MLGDHDIDYERTSYEPQFAMNMIYIRNASLVGWITPICCSVCPQMNASIHLIYTIIAPSMFMSWASILRSYMQFE